MVQKFYFFQARLFSFCHLGKIQPNLAHIRCLQKTGRSRTPGGPALVVCTGPLPTPNLWLGHFGILIYGRGFILSLHYQRWNNKVDVVLLS